MFMRFCQRAGQLFGIVCTILGCGVILPINMDHGDGTQGRFESVTLANVPEGRKILWVHAVSVWLFTFATFAILLELGREFAYLRHRYLRYNIYHRTTQPTAERQSIDDEQRVNSPVDAHAHEEVSSSLEVKVSPHLPSTTAAEDSQISSAVADERLSSSAVRFESSDPQPDMLPPWVINTTELEPNAPFVLNPRPYTIMVENLPSWINCDTQLYFYFDNLFPGLVHSVSLVQLAEGVDKAYSERNSALRLLEKRDRLQKKYENSKVSNMHKGGKQNSTSREHVCLIRSSPSNVTLQTSRKRSLTRRIDQVIFIWSYTRSGADGLLTWYAADHFTITFFVVVIENVVALVMMEVNMKMMSSEN